MAVSDSAPRRGPTPNYSGATGGGALLADAIGSESQAQAARALGVTPAFFNHLIHGRKMPGRDLAVKIRDLYGVPVEAW